VQVLQSCDEQLFWEEMMRALPGRAQADHPFFIAPYSANPVI
jgi:hypothetical protein